MSAVRQRKASTRHVKADVDTQQPDSPTKLASSQHQRSFDVVLLVLTAAMYAAVIHVTRESFARVPTPLSKDAPPSLFSEGRAMKHTSYLADYIGDRQVSTYGEEEAAQYLLKHARHMAAAARKHRPDLEVEVEREQVTGGVTMHAFKFEITNVYNNLTNIVMRIAPKGSTAKAVLVNSHYDSTLGSAGASDAASCVGVAMELARTLIANRALQLAAPVVLLFNGGEETLSQAANGFMQSSRFASQLGAFINLESTGPWGPDVVFQHTGEWTLQAYARSAPNPRGTTVAQDFFDMGLIPADTDYRMLSYRHYGNLPGIDTAFIGGGTVYHTQRDEVERIRPGTLQAMGDNVLAAVLEFGRVLASGAPPPSPDTSRSVFFDILGKYMVVYSHRMANVLHSLPLFAICVLGALSSASGAGKFPTLPALLGSAALALVSFALGLLAPAVVGGVRAYASRTPYIWYGKPAVAYAIYLPAAVAGMMLPYVIAPWQWRVAAGPNHLLGYALLFAALSSLLTSAGMHSAFLFAVWAAAAAAAGGVIWRRGRRGGRGVTTPRHLGLEGALQLLVALTGPLLVSMPTSLSIAEHVMEKIGLAGAVPGPKARWIGDASVGVVCGMAALLALGIVIPVLVGAAGKGGRVAVLLLLAASVGSSVWASKTQSVYSYDHPKRLLVQHIHKHNQAGQVSESQFSFAQLDNYPMGRILHRSIQHLQKSKYSNVDWEAFYPLNMLVGGMARKGDAPDPHLIPSPPTLTLTARTNLTQEVEAGAAAEGEALERLTLELNTHIGAWAVLNVTGDVRGWSLSDSVAGGTGNASSHIVRYSSNLVTSRYSFWVDVPYNSPLEVHTFVKYVPLTPALSMLKNTGSGLLSMVLVTTYQSQARYGGPALAPGKPMTFSISFDEEGKMVVSPNPVDPVEHDEEPAAPAGSVDVPPADLAGDADVAPAEPAGDADVAVAGEPATTGDAEGGGAVADA